MKLTSPAFEHEGRIPREHTCDGEGSSPPLIIADLPDKTKSLALIVDDPDAPGGTFVHWLLWNIPPETLEIREGGAPGVEGLNNFGQQGYGGPCPPEGAHRYFFKLYALDASLDLPEGASKTDVRNAIKSHLLAETELMGVYARQ